MSDEEKDINKKNIKQILQTTKNKLKELWIKLWGKDLPEDMSEIFPDDKFDIDEQLELYEKLNKKQKRKRFIVSITIIFIVIAGFNYLKNSISFAIKNNPTIACWNKSICSYEGAKDPYPSRNLKSVVLDNGNIFIFKNHYRNFRVTDNFFVRFIDNLFNLNLSYDTKGNFFEIYDIHKKKFIKLPQYKDNNRILHFNIIKNNIGEIVFYNDFIVNDKKDEEELLVYNLKKKQFYKRNIVNSAKAPLVFLTKYGSNILYMTNKSDSEFLKEHRTRPVKNQNESLYIFNTDTFEFSKFADFEVEPKYFPYSNGIITLKNGKIIFPVYDIESIYDKKTRDYVWKFNWDHIEIYDPETNKFYAEMNTDILTENLFHLEQNDSTTIFVNENSSYRLVNNDFIKETNENAKKNETIVLGLLHKIDNYWAVQYENRYGRDVNYIELAPNKLLFTCGTSQTFEYSNRKGQLCSSTLLLDYDNDMILEGPKINEYLMLYHHFKISDTETMFLGGDKINGGNHSIYFPNKETIVVKVK